MRLLHLISFLAVTLMCTVGLMAGTSPREPAPDIANDPQETLPPDLPRVELAKERAANVYQNVKVLGRLDVAEFNRTMAAMTNWVAPNQGCLFCHSADGNFASDKIRAKVISRGMLKLTHDLNTGPWKSHVGDGGVTCYTCHRGHPIPTYAVLDTPLPPNWDNRPAESMVQALNENLKEILDKSPSAHRHVPMIDCAMCHRGREKPLGGKHSAEGYTALHGR